MKVNFNNVRLQACKDFNRLVSRLDRAVGENGVVTIAAEEIRNPIDGLRMALATIACSYEEGNEDFRDLGEEIGELAGFCNDEDQEDEEDL